MAVAALELSFLLNNSAAQSGAIAKAEQVIKIPFFAADAYGKPVRVTQSDLEVLDNRKPARKVLGVRGRAETPLLLGILIDNSGSEQGNSLYGAFVRAAADFPNHVLTGRDDAAFFEKFGATWEATEPLSKAEFLALKIDVIPFGRTALYDAVRFASDERMNTARDFLRVMVLVSDGEDNHSRSNLEQAVESAQKAGAIIFTVDTGEHRLHALPHGTLPGYVTLGKLAEKTGGIAFLRLSPESLRKAFETIEQQIATLNLVSYVATDSDRGGRYHSLQLRAASKTGQRMRVPKGYYSRVPNE